jgi:hypothetical protein
MACQPSASTNRQAKYLEKQFDEANSQLRDIVSTMFFSFHATLATETVPLHHQLNPQFHSQQRQQESS